jgi:hypothetical protein
MHMTFHSVVLLITEWLFHETRLPLLASALLVINTMNWLMYIDRKPNYIPKGQRWRAKAKRCVQFAISWINPTTNRQRAASTASFVARLVSVAINNFIVHEDTLMMQLLVEAQAEEATDAGSWLLRLLPKSRQLNDHSVVKERDKEHTIDDQDDIKYSRAIREAINREAKDISMSISNLPRTTPGARGSRRSWWR